MYLIFYLSYKNNIFCLAVSFVRTLPENFSTMCDMKFPMNNVILYISHHIKEHHATQFDLLIFHYRHVNLTYLIFHYRHVTEVSWVMQVSQHFSCEKSSEMQTFKKLLYCLSSFLSFLHQENISFLRSFKTALKFSFSSNIFFSNDQKG